MTSSYTTAEPHHTCNLMPHAYSVTLAPWESRSNHLSAMRKISGYTVCKQYGDRRYHPGVKFIKWILVPSKKADGLTERQMKINGYDNLHICDQETDLTADCPPSNSRLTKSQLLHFSFAFYFHLWGEKACGLVWPGHAKISWRCTLQTDTMKVS